MSDLPLPVGMTASTSRPERTARITCSWPGRKAPKRNTWRSTRAARSSRSPTSWDGSLATVVTTRYRDEGLLSRSRSPDRRGAAGAPRRQRRRERLPARRAEALRAGLRAALRAGLARFAAAGGLWQTTSTLWPSGSYTNAA